MINATIRNRKIHYGFKPKSNCLLPFRFFSRLSGILNHLEEAEAKHHVGGQKKSVSPSCYNQALPHTEQIDPHSVCERSVFYSFLLPVNFACLYFLHRLGYQLSLTQTSLTVVKNSSLESEEPTRCFTLILKD